MVKQSVVGSADTENIPDIEQIDERWDRRILVNNRHLALYM